MYPFLFRGGCGIMTLPPVLVVGSSFQLWSAGLLPFSICFYRYSTIFSSFSQAFFLYFQCFRGFFSLRVFWPDLVRGGGGIYAPLPPPGHVRNYRQQRKDPFQKSRKNKKGSIAMTLLETFLPHDIIKSKGG